MQDGVGQPGGSCLCPNGEAYWVGTKDNAVTCAGGILACIDGVAGTCSEAKGKWSHNQVTCKKVISQKAKTQGRIHSSQSDRHREPLTPNHHGLHIPIQLLFILQKSRKSKRRWHAEDNQPVSGQRHVHLHHDRNVWLPNLRKRDPVKNFRQLEQ